MTFSELVNQISEGTGLPRTKAAACLKSFAAAVLRTTGAGERVTIPHFGAFYAVENKNYKLFGKGLLARRKKLIRFKPARAEV